VSPADDEVRFYDRATGEVRREVVYAEGGVRWLYQTRLGRILGHVLSARLPSVLYGAWLDSRFSRGKIRGFAAALSIDLDEASRAVDEYPSFNAFFARALKPGRRTISADPAVLASPADGRVWGRALDQAGMTLPIKGVPFTVARLLDDAGLAARYRGGTAIVVRLCPADYHRFHFPDGGIPGPARRVGGRLHSVNPMALASGLEIFDRNAREVTQLESDGFGTIAYVEVGAMFVGRIVQTFRPHERVARGDEKGYFTFGASTVVLVLEPGRLVLDADIADATARGLETRLALGDSLGRRP